MKPLFIDGSLEITCSRGCHAHYTEGKYADSGQTKSQQSTKYFPSQHSSHYISDICIQIGQGLSQHKWSRGTTYVLHDWSAWTTYAKI